MTPTTTAQPVSEGTDGLRIPSGRGGATALSISPGARAVKTADYLQSLTIEAKEANA